MKIFAILIVIISAALVKSLDPEEKKKILMKVLGECKDSNGATDDDITRLLVHAKPETEAARCMFSCFLENMGIIKDGRMIHEGILAWGKSLNVEPDILEKIYNECSGETDADMCESATKIGQCFMVAKKKYNVLFD